MAWRGSGQSSPMCATLASCVSFGMWIILSWRESRSCRLKKHFYLFLKNFNWGLTHNKSYYQKYFFICYLYGRTNISTLIICFSYNPPKDLFPSEASGPLPHSLAQDVMYISFYLSVSEHVTYVVCPCIHMQLNFVTLPY